MPITPSALRADLYNLLDEVIATGRPLEIARNGVVLRLLPPEPAASPFDRLPRREGAILGDPDDLVQVDGGFEWSPDAP